jgi:hypothetical protein
MALGRLATFAPRLIGHFPEAAMCSFAPRCRFAEPGCRHTTPPEVALASDRAVRCLRVAAGEVAMTTPKPADQSVW